MMEFLYVEKTELIYTNLNQPNPPTHNIPYSTISTIFYGVRTKKAFFGLLERPEHYLTIKAGGAEYTITEKDVGRELLEQYIERVKGFAHDNRVTMRETAGDDKEDGRL